MHILKKLLEKKFEQSYELFTRNIIAKIKSNSIATNQPIQDLNSILITVYMSILKSDKITFAFFKQIYALIVDIYKTSSPLEMFLQNIEDFKQYFWNNQYFIDQSDEKKYFKQLIHNINFLEYFYENQTWNGCDNLFSYIFSTSKVAFQFIINKNRIVNMNIKKEIITKIFENPNTTNEMKMVLINEHSDKLNFKFFEFECLNLEIIKHPNFPADFKKGYIFAHMNYITEEFILENLEWDWYAPGLFNNQNISWQFLKEHFSKQIKTDLPPFFIQYYSSSSQSQYILNSRKKINPPITRNDIPQIEFESFNIINPLRLNTNNYSEQDSDNDSDTHSKRISNLSHKYKYWGTITFEEVRQKVALNQHIKNCNNSKDCRISHDEGEYPIRSELFICGKFTAEQFIEFIPLMYHTNYFFSAIINPANIVQEMINYHIDLLHQNNNVSINDLIKIIRHFPDYVCLNYMNFYIIKIYFDNYFRADKMTSEYIDLILSRLLDPKPEIITVLKLTFGNKFIRNLIRYGFNYDIFLKNNAKKEIAAFRIQNRYQNALVNPYTELGIRKINRDYDFMVNGFAALQASKKYE